ncbi:2Fe-2S iron-sulfur cluster-binding protein [Roseomonas sp. KE2513]|uniref:2Fe-2S iron-sulfur cluster-binding protein n=1 Tax=Roseomonas sp. KE2513 TaxID=2479202 RepID=UPI0018DF601E|nr:2Fe-2S iron-sulfur cluster-binding protein [Roseomonas sp. KE2513]
MNLARSGRSLAATPGRSILDAITAVGVEAPHSCLQGICGDCETRVLAGTPDHRGSILSEAERQAGVTTDDLLLRRTLGRAHPRYLTAKEENATPDTHITSPDSGTGYDRPKPTYDRALTELGRGTPMGELLRRYWHPVGLSSDAGSTPKQVRALGELRKPGGGGAARAGQAHQAPRHGRPQSIRRHARSADFR